MDARIRLVGLPLRLYSAMVEQHESMVRECALVALAADAGQRVASDRLRRLSENVRDRYRPLRVAMDGAIEVARRDGRDVAEVTLDGSDGLVSQVEESVRLLDELDDLCRAEELLVTPSTDAVVALRHWVRDEVRAQAVDGREPSPPPL